MKPSIMRWLRQRKERSDEANFDPVQAERFQEGMLRAREKMQRELERKTMEYQEEEERVSGALTLQACGYGLTGSGKGVVY